MRGKVPRGKKGLGSIFLDPKSGKWYSQIEGSDGKRIREAFSTREEAARRLKELNYLKSTAGVSKPSPRLTGHFLDWWLADVLGPTVKPNTLINYESISKNYIKAQAVPRLTGQQAKIGINKGIAHIPLGKLTAENMLSFFSDLAADGVSVRVREQIRIVLRQCLDKAVTLLLMPFNPCLSIRLPTYEPKPPVALSEDTVIRLLEVAADDQHFALLYLACVTGARIGELLALSWATDVNMQSGIITINHTLVDRQGRQELGTPKTKGSRRTIPLSDEARVVLESHRQRLLDLGISLERVFPNANGGWLSASNFVRRTFKGWLRMAGLPKEIRFKDLRSTAATTLQRQGYPITLAAKILGHSNTKTTERYYTAVDDEWKREGTNALSNVFKRPKPKED